MRLEHSPEFLGDIERQKASPESKGVALGYVFATGGKVESHSPHYTPSGFSCRHDSPRPTIEPPGANVLECSRLWLLGRSGSHASRRYPGLRLGISVPPMIIDILEANLIFRHRSRDSASSSTRSSNSEIHPAGHDLPLKCFPRFRNGFFARCMLRGRAEVHELAVSDEPGTVCARPASETLHRRRPPTPDECPPGAILAEICAKPFPRQSPLAGAGLARPGPRCDAHHRLSARASVALPYIGPGKSHAQDSSLRRSDGSNCCECIRDLPLDRAKRPINRIVRRFRKGARTVRVV